MARHKWCTVAASTARQRAPAGRCCRTMQSCSGLSHDPCSCTTPGRWLWRSSCSLCHCLSVGSPSPPSNVLSQSFNAHTVSDSMCVARWSSCTSCDSWATIRKSSARSMGGSGMSGAHALAAADHKVSVSCSAPAHSQQTSRQRHNATMSLPLSQTCRSTQSTIWLSPQIGWCVITGATSLGPFLMAPRANRNFMAVVSIFIHTSGVTR